MTLVQEFPLGSKVWWAGSWLYVTYVGEDWIELHDGARRVEVQHVGLLRRWKREQEDELEHAGERIATQFNIANVCSGYTVTSNKG